MQVQEVFPLIQDRIRKHLQEVAVRVKAEGLKRYAFEVTQGGDDIVISQNYLEIDLVKLAKMVVRGSFTKGIGGFVKSDGKWSADLRPDPGDRVGRIEITGAGLEVRVRVQ